MIYLAFIGVFAAGFLTALVFMALTPVEPYITHCPECGCRLRPGTHSTTHSD